MIFYDTAPASLDVDVVLTRIGAIYDEYKCYGYRRGVATLRNQGVMLHVRDPLSLCNVENALVGCGIDIGHKASACGGTGSGHSLSASPMLWLSPERWGDRWRKLYSPSSVLRRYRRRP